MTRTTEPEANGGAAAKEVNEGDTHDADAGEVLTIQVVVIVIVDAPSTCTPENLEANWIQQREVAKERNLVDLRRIARPNVCASESSGSAVPRGSSNWI